MRWRRARRTPSARATPPAASSPLEDALLRRYHEKPGLQPRLDSFHELAGDDDRGLRDILGDYLASRPCVRAGDRRRAETATDSEAFAAEAHRLSSYFSRTTVDQGATLFDAGDDAANIYFVQNGTVDLSVKKSKARPARRIMRVKRGAVLGELMFLLKQEQTLTATAATHTDLWTLGRAAHAAGLPPKVLKYSGPAAKASLSSRLATTAASGNPLPKGLPTVTASGTTPRARRPGSPRRRRCACSCAAASGPSASTRTTRRASRARR